MDTGPILVKKKVGFSRSPLLINKEARSKEENLREMRLGFLTKCELFNDNLAPSFKRSTVGIKFSLPENK